MTRRELQPLPLSTSSFTALRQFNQIYVDKTDLIYELCKDRSKYFLTRPRRFGKSLLISTIASLFKNRLEDLKDLKIEKLWKDTGSYDVLELDFSLIFETNDEEEYKKNAIVFFANSIRLTDPSAEIRSLGDIQLWFASRPINSLVLLIDEYDAPLTRVLHKPEYFESRRKLLAYFYSMVKAYDAAFRLVFITGITKFNKVSIFSELNSLVDISLNPKYGTILGYTHAEVKSYFKDYLDTIAKKTGYSTETLLEQLTKSYDGFCFDRQAKYKLFAPWSLLNFLQNPDNGFQNYWFESGGQPTVLANYLKTHLLSDPLEYDKIHYISASELFGARDPDSLSELALLTQTGYLTIKGVINSADKLGTQDGVIAEDLFSLGYPNLEVKQAMASVHLLSLMSRNTLDHLISLDPVGIMRNKRPEAFVNFLNKFFCSFSYRDLKFVNEFMIRATVYALLSSRGVEVLTEREQGKGRSDIELSVGNRHWVLEFKCADSDKPKNADRLLIEAVDQIKSQKYGEHSLAHEIIRLALVYDKDKAEFVKWAEVPVTQ